MHKRNGTLLNNPLLHSVPERLCTRAAIQGQALRSRHGGQALRATWGCYHLRMTTLRAGAAVADITPPVGGLMDGYGGRFEGSKGVHDPLMARVVVLEQAKEGAASSAPTRVALVSCDLLGMHRDITARVRERAEAHGIAPEGVVVAATHDHAGPHGLRGGMFSSLNEELAAALVEKVSGAITEAVAGLRPATLSVRKAYLDTVSMNRRDPHWPIDPILRLALLDGEDGPIASILNFACHATVLSGVNMMLSGEFPGAASRLLLEQTGAPCVYLNGACGNVNPVWVKQDFDSVERVGQVIGGQALRMTGVKRWVPGSNPKSVDSSSLLLRVVVRSSDIAAAHSLGGVSRTTKVNYGLVPRSQNGRGPVRTAGRRTGTGRRGRWR